MADQLFADAKKAALSAHKKGYNSVHIHGITMRIENAHHDDFMVLLPNGTEIFRIVGKGRTARIYAV